MKIAVINGPNLNLLGKREKEIYGDAVMDDGLQSLASHFPHADIFYAQSNSESELIGLIHQADREQRPVILNPGGLTHCSVSLADAVKAVSVPVVEVHVSHIMARENYRKRSLVAAACKGTISGFGLNSYLLAAYALQMQNQKTDQ